MTDVDIRLVWVNIQTEVNRLDGAVCKGLTHWVVITRQYFDSQHHTDSEKAIDYRYVFDGS